MSGDKPKVKLEDLEPTATEVIYSFAAPEGSQLQIRICAYQREDDESPWERVYITDEVIAILRNGMNTIQERELS